MRYEYLHATIKIEKFEQDASIYGDAGWKLIQAVPLPECYFYFCIFERPVPEHQIVMPERDQQIIQQESTAP
jgi:hypothetical protein